jgi:hypothetical protein
MSKPKAPPPPDYAAAATAQGQANTGSAIATNYLNQVNQVGPYGSLTYTNNGQNYTLPDGTVIPGRTATTTLSPAEQAKLDANNAITNSLNTLAQKGIGYVGDAMSKPITSESVGGSLSRGLATTNFKDSIDPTKLGIKGSYDFSKLSAMPKKEEFAAQRDKITDAMMQRLQPYLDKQRAAMDVRLANQGITHGSEAYNWDFDQLNRGENDQRIAALLAGDTEAQRLFENAMGIRQQGMGEAVAQGNFGNAAQAQEFGQKATNAEFYNKAQEAKFGQGLASSQFQNQARAQAIQEADYFKNQPLNMLNALRTGGQANVPTFGNAPGTGANIAPAPIYAAAQDQYAAAMQQYQTKLQQQQALMGGVAGLGGAALTGGFW